MFSSRMAAAEEEVAAGAAGTMGSSISMGSPAEEVPGAAMGATRGEGAADGAGAAEAEDVVEPPVTSSPRIDVAGTGDDAPHDDPEAGLGVAGGQSPVEVLTLGAEEVVPQLADSLTVSNVCEFWAFDQDDLGAERAGGGRARKDDDEPR